VIGATNVTIQSSEIGPCGEDNSAHRGNGVHIRQSHGINIYDSYIHVENRTSGKCCDYHDGVLVSDGSDNIIIQGNVIAYNETNVELMGRHGAINHVSIIGNYFLNPRGPFPRGQNFQSWSGTTHNSKILVSDNYTFSCTTHNGTSGIACPSESQPYLHSEDQQDSINFGYSDNVTARSNWIEGGHSTSGCGIILDKNVTGGRIENNVLSDIGQCGVGVAGGTDHVVSGNRVLSLKAPGNVGIYVWNQYRGPCGPVTVSNNIASVLASSSPGCVPDTESCNFNGYWNRSCEIADSDNVFDNGVFAAGGGPGYRALRMFSISNPAPLIPPKPKNCVANSPYSTQTSAPACN
jgi:hypothetical protein